MTSTGSTRSWATALAGAVLLAAAVAGVGPAAPAIAWAAPQLRVDPVLASRPDISLQAVRARAVGLSRSEDVIALVQTPLAQYEVPTRSRSDGSVTVDLPLAGAVSEPEARSSVALLQEGRSVAVASLPAFTGRGPGLLLLMGLENDALAYLALAKQTSGVPLAGRAISAVELPERWYGYGPVSALVADAESLETLSNAQRTSLLDWLMSGGFLVTYPGLESPAPRQETLALLSPLFPSSARARQRTVSARPLAAKLGKGVSLGRLEVWPSTLSPDAGAVTSGGLPLVASRRVGAGTWTALAFDPAHEAIDDSAHRKALWAWVFSQGGGFTPEAGAVFGRPLWGEPPPPLRVPSGFSLAAVGLLYVMLVGPVNFLVLRRTERRDLAWATIPAISAIFTAAMFGVGFAARGGPLSCYQTELVVWGPEADRGLARLGVSVFSPRTARYKVDLMGDWVPIAATRESSLPDPRFRAKIESGSAVVRDLVVPRWSIRRFSASGIVRRPAPMEFELERRGKRVTGALRNVSSAMLDVWIRVPGHQPVPVGTFAPNQTRSVNVAVSHGGAIKVERSGWERSAIAYLLNEGVAAHVRTGDVTVVAMPQRTRPAAVVPSARNRVAVLWVMPAPGTATR